MMAIMIIQTVAGFIFSEMLSRVYSFGKKLLSIKYRFYKTFKTDAYVFIVAGRCSSGIMTRADRSAYKAPYYQLGIGDAYCLAYILKIFEFLESDPDITMTPRNADPNNDPRLKQNIICIGGPASNKVTEIFIKAINQDKFKWEPPYHQYVIEGNSIGSPRQGNYGVIIKGPNPFSPESSLLILAGLGDTGSAAAGKVAQGAKVSEMYKKIKRSKDDYIATVVKGKMFEDRRSETWKVEECEISEMITLEALSETDNKGIIRRVWERIW